jgi:hypothetical protein
MKTRQDFILDTLRGYFLDPSTISINPDTGFCMYRGPNGTMCGIGKHIPDDKYEPKMDTEYGVENLLKSWPNCLSAEMVEQNLNPVQLATIQTIHDNLQNAIKTQVFGDLKHKITNCEKDCEVDLQELRDIINNKLKTN